jgi:hypothetical protein
VATLTAGGSGNGRTMSRARALGGNKKLLSVARESTRPEILDHGA